MPCDRAGKLPAEGRDLYFWGMTFVPLDSASRLLENPKNIYELIQNLFLLLDVQASPYEKALDCIQFSYTGDQMGAYLTNASMVLVWFVLLEGGPIFAPTLMHIW